MSDSDTPRPDHPQLEPWFLDLEASNPDGADPRRREELERVVALLRSLPDPETPSGLGDTILSRVAKESARPRVLRGAFGVAGRAATLALAAGIAGLLVVTGPPGFLAPWLPGPDSEGSDSLVIRVPSRALGQGFAAAGAVRRGPGAQLVSIGAPPQPANPFAGLSAWERHLDRHLNQLQLDPHAYAKQLESAAGRDDFIAQLARRAGVRGDAPEIAMRVRSSPHPVAGQIVQRMLRASLVQSVSRR